jgi:CubicO group peptidase (beta-lactamase class C family)
MALIDDGKLSLQSKVFGPHGIISDAKYFNTIDSGMNDITVKDLLDHSGGWTQRYGDPMFNPILICELTGQQPPATLDTYLNFVSSRRLHFKPGTASSYSNMGYVFLGEVIKRISGMEYEDFVKSRVLLPLGLFDMHIGASYQNEKRKNEVVYYEHETSIPFSHLMAAENLYAGHMEATILNCLVLLAVGSLRLLSWPVFWSQLMDLKTNQTFFQKKALFS